MLTVNCPHCGQIHNIRSTTINRIKGCDNCGKKFQVKGCGVLGGCLLLILLFVGGVFAWEKFLKDRPEKAKAAPEPPVNAPPPTAAGKPQPDKVTQPVPEKVEPENPAVKAERDAAQLLTLARTLEESAKAARDMQQPREADRLLDRARSRYADIVAKHPDTGAAVQSREALKRLK